MIRYALRCNDGHTFDSWFKSAAAFETLASAGRLSCAVCGNREVRKSMMAPQVAEMRAPDVPTTVSDRDATIAAMRRNVEENATYVGGNFAQKARDIHEGTAPASSIYGEANVAEARKLIEDGVPVMPLPFKPRRKMQ